MTITGFVGLLERDSFRFSIRYFCWTKRIVMMFSA